MKNSTIAAGTHDEPGWQGALALLAHARRSTPVHSSGVTPAARNRSGEGEGRRKEIGSAFTIGDNVPVKGTVRLSGAHVHGNVCLRGASLSAPEGRHLVAAQGVRIDGEVELQGLAAADGDLGFRAAMIGSVVDASGAHLRNPGGYTLNLHQANVRGSVRLTDSFESHGEVVLNRATIEGRFTCVQGSFDCPAPSERNQYGRAIEMISATVRAGMDLGWREPPYPSVDFTNTTTSFLADDPARWPSRFVVSGFAYDRFEQTQSGGSGRTWDHAARCAWLSQQAAYDAGPYEQAARVFRQHGYTDGAKAILIAQRRHARRTISGRWSLPRRALDATYDITVRYGYRPGRVLWLLGLLLVLVTGSLQLNGPQTAMRATNAGAVYTTQGPIRSSQCRDYRTRRAERHVARGTHRCLRGWTGPLLQFSPLRD